ncbi:MAG TPA: SGNH/GDSL hydrolase family protein, partial [Acetobacteraceae bacterium]|nr:SGNH/GDSL hydrolase family protein [Acetobacteraceae bacterium]
GVGGEDAAEMLARLDRDVLAERPQLVIWQAGGNGAMRGRDPEEFRTLLAAGIARLREAGADVILMDNQRAPRILAAPAAPRFEAAMAALARTLGIGLFARGRLMDVWASAGVPADALLVGDGIHHNDRGYACLAAALAGSLVAGLRDSGPVLTARR